VAERFCNVGDTCGRPFESSGSRSEAAFVLTDPDRLRAVFYRPQRELPLFRADGAQNGGGAAELELRVIAEALPGKTFRGVIERIAPTIDPRSGNFRVVARLDPLPVAESQAGSEDDATPAARNADRLLPGMLVRLAIVTERRPEALVVHKRAIQREGDTSLVYLVRDGKAVRVVVEEGLSDEERVEIKPLDGASVAAGEVVVLVGQRDLEDGAEVALTFLDAAAPGTERLAEALPQKDLEGQ
jgi:membrane fusion protein (multidrug efflux system)